MKKVLIINEGFSDNLGDQAIYDATQRFYKAMGFEIDFLYLSRPSLKELPKYNYQHKLINDKKKISSLKKRLYFYVWFLRNRNVIIEQLRNRYDIISFGGGQLLNGSNTIYKSQFAIAFFWFQKLIKKYAPNSKKIFLSVGAGGIYNSHEKKIFSRILNSADLIFVRDSFSQDVLKHQFKIDSYKMPDIAFYKNDEDKNINIKHELALLSIANYEEVVKRYSTKSKEQYYNDILEKVFVYEAKGFHVKGFYTTRLDYISFIDFNEFFKQKTKRSIEIEYTDSLEKLLNVFSKSKIVFSGRMHALILALQYYNSIEVYRLSQKLKSFEEEIQSFETFKNKFIEIKDLIMKSSIK